jgi:hypothetical protein
MRHAKMRTGDRRGRFVGSESSVSGLRVGFIVANFCGSLSFVFGTALVVLGLEDAVVEDEEDADELDFTSDFFSSFLDGATFGFAELALPFAVAGLRSGLLFSVSSFSLVLSAPFFRFFTTSTAPDGPSNEPGASAEMGFTCTPRRGAGASSSSP